MATSAAATHRRAPASLCLALVSDSTEHDVPGTRPGRPLLGLRPLFRLPRRVFFNKFARIPQSADFLAFLYSLRRFAWVAEVIRLTQKKRSPFPLVREMICIYLLVRGRIASFPRRGGIPCSFGIMTKCSANVPSVSKRMSNERQTK